MKARLVPLTADGADELRGCGEARPRGIHVDTASDCYKAWLARHPKPFVPPPLPVASDAEIAALFERDKLGGCGCDPPGKR
jgi:hypothetical protein